MIRILIADDHPVVRKGLKEILIHELREAFCGEAATAQEVLEEVARSHWDLVILDISMPGRSGLDALKEIKLGHPKLPVLILSAHPEAQYGERALIAGASGYMHKENAPDELVRALKQILAGRRYLSPGMVQSLTDHLRPDPGRLPHESLSDRELELLRLLGAGKTAAQIAQDLRLSSSTIGTYRARLLIKMNMKTNAELMHYAISNGLTDGL